MTAVNTPWAWQANLPWLHRVRLASLVAGVAFVLYLVYTELFTLDAICLWCTSVHVITVLLFALIVMSPRRTGAGTSAAEPSPGTGRSRR